jgi:coiled-coil and C2 domain-containing protein 2A
MVHKIAEIFLPIPSNHEIFEKLPLTMYEFSSDKLKINGKLNLKIGWSYAGDDSAEHIALTKKSTTQLSKTLLDRWHEDGILNPLDPDTQDLMNVVNKVQQSEVATTSKPAQKLFRFNEDRLTFCSGEEIENNERFNILIARYNNDLKYKSAKFVPQMEREIEVNDEMKIVDETIGMDPIDLQRHRGKRYLKSVYATLTNYCENLESESRNSNILIGDEMPSFGYTIERNLNLLTNL